MYIFQINLIFNDMSFNIRQTWIKKYIFWSQKDKVCVCNAGDPGSIPGLGRCPGEGNTAAHSSILVWKIPWMAEPGRLPSTGSQRVGHN